MLRRLIRSPHGLRHFASTPSPLQHWNNASVLYGCYLTVGFTVPFLLSYYETYSQHAASTYPTKHRCCARAIFARWI
ncbi:AaceriAAR108WBp [[Ashbya] aceris (nom. inval.)]|nr:AaceriAAR108WBp [[Ashbya] aceris (nom. inval.)]